MEMLPVISSNVAEIGWEEESLYVRFKSGALYQYFDVPVEVYEAMVIAPSKGKFLHQEVKDTYEYERVE